ncbi:efflux RND transporter periplasmic adaptor subunit [Pseudogulbenkiania subflava]|uniref:RND family efflux transporter, MFP subunit n=1 Tax=Pseudogulbenkiania subflava DSM 22618 TaxID=1123014 RepID=A0A1Y6C8S0_9NEIS|nr:efflux RND transporter periplasmic adaptor subunit [Pseudogulbenkiania subflava]SMF48610.1 RND family efflux transporter, MFP subunit [Pseudogulbenkiania subflava DSM 22618]
MASNDSRSHRKSALYRAGKGAFFLLLAAGLSVLLWHWLAPPMVKVGHPTRGPAIQAVYATGNVEASVTVTIAPQVGGRLVELRADEGAEVTPGQILGRLDDSDLRASLGDEQARLRYAEQRWQRVQALFSSGFATIDQLDQARSTFDSARATTRRIEEQIKFMTLRAPGAGHIIRRDGEVGDFIPLNQPVFYLAQSGAPPRITTVVDEEDIAGVKVGQPAQITADGFPGRVFEGKVAEITAKGDPLARNYRVRIALLPGTPLMIGMTTEVNIILARREHALLVPSTALNGSAIWLVRDGRAHKQSLSLGARGADRSEVLVGLNDGDTFIAEPPAELKDGQKVRAQPDAAPAGTPR